ncbi:MAG TPA: thioredoxin family protein [Dehalococcoidia bacterium]|nr:thioredoxin family protein [Dehalococcoidia bacterium]
MIPLREQELLREKFAAEMAGQVKVDFFTQKELSITVPGRQECEYCKPAGIMLRELSRLTGSISLRAHMIEDERQEAARYGVGRIPAIVIRDAASWYATFYGFPGGTLFPAFIQVLTDVSRGMSLLSEESQQRLMQLKDEVRLQVFVTTTCPYSPNTAHMAYHVAMASPLVHTEVIEITEFPDLYQRYNVQAVPLTLVTIGGLERAAIPGAVAESVFVDTILRASGIEVTSEITSAGPTSPVEMPTPGTQQAGQQRPSGLIIPGR